MEREIRFTSDGSTTIFLPELNESYHSKHGAIQEAYHVFIHNGLELFQGKDSVSILEMGFGTGLNAFITFLESKKMMQNIEYVGIEAYPVSVDEWAEMNYVSQLNSTENFSYFKMMHEILWDEKYEISNNFKLTKRKQFFEDIDDVDQYDLIYFDAFGFTAQPEVWSEEIFKKMYLALRNNGVLVTYACRTSIKNAMLNSGFSIEKLPGAPGKREMLRARKINSI